MGVYVRLVDYNTQQTKENAFLSGSDRYDADSANFSKIPGMPLAYWVSERFIKNFSLGTNIRKLSNLMTAGNKTADNEKYLRFIWEVNDRQVNVKWYKYAKGGQFRKWYGNIEFIIDWSENAKSFYKRNGSSNLIDKKYWFMQGLTYTDLTSKSFSCRLLNDDMLFDMSGPGILFNDDKLYYCMGVFNSKVIDEYFKTLNTTFHYKLNDLERIPIILIDKYLVGTVGLVLESINVSKTDWDSFETSWDFKKHPLI